MIIIVQSVNYFLLLECVESALGNVLVWSDSTIDNKQTYIIIYTCANLTALAHGLKHFL